MMLCTLLQLQRLFPRVDLSLFSLMLSSHFSVKMEIIKNKNSFRILSYKYPKLTFLVPALKYFIIVAQKSFICKKGGRKGVFSAMA
jgi:hypothetical protein